MLGRKTRQGWRFRECEVVGVPFSKGPQKRPLWQVTFEQRLEGGEGMRCRDFPAAGRESEGISRRQMHWVGSSQAAMVPSG